MFPMGSVLYSLSPACRNMTTAPGTAVAPTVRALIWTGLPLSAWVSAAWVIAGGAPFGLMVTVVGIAGVAATFFSSSSVTAMGWSAEPARAGPFPAMSHASM